MRLQMVNEADRNIGNPLFECQNVLVYDNGLYRVFIWKGVIILYVTENREGCLNISLLACILGELT